MDTLFKSNPELIFFIFFKKYIYLEILCVLGFLRLYAHRARLDFLALLSLIISVIGLIFLFALPYFGIYEGQLSEFARGIINWQNGSGMLLIATLPLSLSALRPYVRWGWIDFIHGVLVGALILLYWITTTH